MNQFFSKNNIVKKPRGDILSTRRRTPEQKERYRKCKLGDKNPMKKLTGINHPNYNKVWTEEERQKMMIPPKRNFVQMKKLIFPHTQDNLSHIHSLIKKFKKLRIILLSIKNGFL